jgi:hypothetical protein
MNGADNLGALFSSHVTGTTVRVGVPNNLGFLGALFFSSAFCFLGAPLIIKLKK